MSLVGVIVKNIFSGDKSRDVATPAVLSAFRSTIVAPTTYVASLPINLTYAFDIWIPADVTRVRAWFANRDMATGAHPVGTTTIDVGWYTTNGSGAAAGSVVGKQTGVVIPGSGSRLMTNWVNVSSIVRGSDGKIVLAHTVPAGTEMYTENNITHGKRADGTASVDPLPAMSSTTSCSLSIHIEYETAVRRVVTITDSLGRAYLATFETGPFYSLGPGHGFAVDVAGVVGATLVSFHNGTKPWLTDHINFNGVTTIIEAQINDLPSQTLSSFQTSLGAAVNMAIAAGANQDKVYVTTGTPSVSYLANNTVRNDCNNYTRTLPLGIAGVIDCDLLLRNPGTPSALAASKDAGDGTHWNASADSDVAAETYTVLTT